MSIMILNWLRNRENSKAVSFFSKEYWAYVFKFFLMLIIVIFVIFLTLKFFSLTSTPEYIILGSVIFVSLISWAILSKFTGILWFDNNFYDLNKGSMRIWITKKNFNNFTKSVFVPSLLVSIFTVILYLIFVTQGTPR